MRKFAMLSTALVGLAFATSSHAQPAQSGPQPGLPPGASIGAPNAQPPRATGSVTTTTTGAQPAPAPMPMATGTSEAPPRHMVRHRRVRHPRHVRHVTHAKAPAAETPPAQ